MSFIVLYPKASRTFLLFRKERTRAREVRALKIRNDHFLRLTLLLLFVELVAFLFILQYQLFINYIK